MINKIKKVLADRLAAAEFEGFIELRMKKSNDVLVIWFDGAANDPETVYTLKSFKLPSLIVHGLDALAEAVRNYDQIVAETQKLISELYAFKKERIDTKKATDAELYEYTETYNRLFGYRPSVAA